MHRSFYTEAFTQNTFTHRSFCTQKLLHRSFYTKKLLHTEAPTHRNFYTLCALYGTNFQVDASVHVHAHKHRHTHKHTHTGINYDVYSQKMVLLGEWQKKDKSHDKKDKSHEHCLQRRYYQKLQLHNRISAPKQKKAQFSTTFIRNWKGKWKAPQVRKFADKAQSWQPWCSHSNTIYDAQLQKTIVLAHSWSF